MTLKYFKEIPWNLFNEYSFQFRNRNNRIEKTKTLLTKSKVEKRVNSSNMNIYSTKIVVDIRRKNRLILPNSIIFTGTLKKNKKNSLFFHLLPSFVFPFPKGSIRLPFRDGLQRLPFRDGYNASHFVEVYRKNKKTTSLPFYVLVFYSSFGRSGKTFQTKISEKICFKNFIFLPNLAAISLDPFFSFPSVTNKIRQNQKYWFYNYIYSNISQKKLTNFKALDDSCLCYILEFCSKFWIKMVALRIYPKEGWTPNNTFLDSLNFFQNMFLSSWILQLKILFLSFQQCEYKSTSKVLLSLGLNLFLLPINFEKSSKSINKIKKVKAIGLFSQRFHKCKNEFFITKSLSFAKFQSPFPKSINSFSKPYFLPLKPGSTVTVPVPYPPKHNYPLKRNSLRGTNLLPFEEPLCVHLLPLKGVKEERSSSKARDEDSSFFDQPAGPVVFESAFATSRFVVFPYASICKNGNGNGNGNGTTDPISGSKKDESTSRVFPLYPFPKSDYMGYKARYTKILENDKREYKNRFFLLEYIRHNLFNLFLGSSNESKRDRSNYGEYSGSSFYDLIESVFQNYQTKCKFDNFFREQKFKLTKRSQTFLKSQKNFTLFQTYLIKYSKLNRPVHCSFFNFIYLLHLWFNLWFSFEANLLAFTQKKQHIFLNSFCKYRKTNFSKIIRFRNQIFIVGSLQTSDNHFTNKLILKEIQKKLTSFSKLITKTNTNAKSNFESISTFHKFLFKHMVLESKSLVSFKTLKNIKGFFLCKIWQQTLLFSSLLRKPCYKSLYPLLCSYCIPCYAPFFRRRIDLYHRRSNPFEVKGIDMGKTTKVRFSSTTSNTVERKRFKNSAKNRQFCTSFSLQNKTKFYFLGFKIRFSNNNLLKFKPYLMPLKEKIRSHLQEINYLIKKSKSKTQEDLIFKLSPKIRQWSIYYQNISIKKIFHYCDYLTLKMIWRWACRKHPKKSRHWIKCKYFFSLNGKNWVFGIYQKMKWQYICLPYHTDTPLVRHDKVIDKKSPYDGDFKYWCPRLS